MAIRTYEYGRCQHNNGTGCIRPLTSPLSREVAGSKPAGNECMLCEDDSYKWADLPEEIWNTDEWNDASEHERVEILDRHTRLNPHYDTTAFKPFND